MEKVKKLGDPLPKKENIMNLVRFLSIFEDPNFRPGESKCEVEGDAVVLYPVEYHHAVYDFMDSCYREGVMFDFDWIKYSGRAKAIETRTPHYKDATLLQMCKILTGHIRCDRFVEGHLLSWFNNGLAVAFLRRLNEIGSSMKDGTLSKRKKKSSCGSS